MCMIGGTWRTEAQHQLSRLAPVSAHILKENNVINSHVPSLPSSFGNYQLMPSFVSLLLPSTILPSPTAGMDSFEANTR